MSELTRWIEEEGPKLLVFVQQNKIWLAAGAALLAGLLLFAAGFVFLLIGRFVRFTGRILFRFGLVLGLFLLLAAGGLFLLISLG